MRVRATEACACGSGQPPNQDAALAGQLDLREDQDMLHQSLEEERRADASLTTLAKGEVNRIALAA
jgi:ferritin-like metal-binding protein YciE